MRLIITRTSEIGWFVHQDCFMFPPSTTLKCHYPKCTNATWGCDFMVLSGKSKDIYCISGVSEQIFVCQKHKRCFMCKNATGTLFQPNDRHSPETPSSIGTRFWYCGECASQIKCCVLGCNNQKYLQLRGHDLVCRAHRLCQEQTSDGGRCRRHVGILIRSEGKYALCMEHFQEHSARSEKVFLKSYIVLKK